MYLSQTTFSLSINQIWRSLLNTSATSPLVHSKGETGALLSSVFEINKSSSIVNFITHVWSCCSDLLFAVWSFGPEGRHHSLKNNHAIMEANVFHTPVLAVFWGPLTQGYVETKHVSVIDVDRSIEVRC